MRVIKHIWNFYRNRMAEDWAFAKEYWWLYLLLLVIACVAIYIKTKHTD